MKKMRLSCWLHDGLWPVLSAFAGEKMQSVRTNEERRPLVLRDQPIQLARLPALVFLILSCLAASFCWAEDWPHWRGPNRNGITAELSGWDGAKWRLSELAWNKNVGEGCTSPVVIGDRLYTMGWRGKDTVYCLGATTGKELWKQSYPCPRYGRNSVGDKGIYSGTTATPSFDYETGYLYTLSVDGDLNCWNSQKQGSHVWGINLYDRYRVPRRPNVGKRNSQRDYGYTSSPLVLKDQLIVEVGSRIGNLVSFDKKDGRQKWVSQSKDEAGHTGSPVPITIDGISCVVVLTLRNLVVTRVDPGHEGATMATFPWITDFGNNIPTPAVHGDTVLITSAYNHFEMCKLRISRTGAAEVWRQEVASGVCSPIVHDGHIYWAWRGIHCLELKTGKEEWVGGKVGTAGSCIVTADDRMIVWSNRGELQLVETAARSPNELQILSERKRLFSTDVWPHVVLANGNLYCKDRDGNIRSFRVNSR